MKVNGTSQVVKRFDRLINKLEKIPEEVEKVVVEATNKASSDFRNAQYDGNNDVVVDFASTEDGFEINASGESVLFIEYGTGVYYPEQHPNSPYERGTYGQGLGKEDTWYYYGEQGTNGEYIETNSRGDLYATHGNPPSMTMYDTSIGIKSKIHMIGNKFK